ncbi:SDR family oxidoreductase [Jannaschia pohangensis]|uniref:SDR family oxidoreductase n=1 Tax=Jannaschia pohangensis TaxID=390807 RepID=UPI001C31C242|nr:SDR family oxidoreductase [Jannaschia pohangensis]
MFGSRLAAMLRARSGFEVLIAGRSAGSDVVLDRSAPDLAARIIAIGPDVVIDAAGPFQDYGDDGYAVARAAIGAGAHYLDLSDDAGFTAGIADLDAQARAAGVAVISGVSSVPALSSAAAAALCEGLDDVHLIESAILPGNRAPRGLSVMQAILAQVGRPLSVWRAGETVARPGWSGLRRDRLPGLPPRWSSLIGAPDLALFPGHFRARSVSFRAGLELPIMHLGLWVMSWLPRLGLVRSLAPAARPLRRMADLLEGLGSDRGGMFTRVVGRDASGKARDRRWTLVAAAGDGPHIPAVPGDVMVARLAAGQVPAGARACIAEFPLSEAETALARLTTTTTREETHMMPMFEAALGDDFARLPKGVRDLHDILHVRRWRGRARIDRGTGLLSRLTCVLFRFPPATEDVAVEVTMIRTDAGETWVRDFGGRKFRSRLAWKNGEVTERFGPMSFTLGLAVEGEALVYPVHRGRCLGLPIPAFALPKSDAFERAEGDRATFDVHLSTGPTGLLVHYRGWLLAADDPPDDAAD